MTEKTAIKTRPSVAILCNDDHVRAYLGDIIALAGFALADGETGEAALTFQDGSLCLQAGENSVTLPVPVRAGRLAEQLRRIGQNTGGAPAIIEFGPYVLSTREYLLLRSGEEGEPALRLTEKETALLVYLAQKRGSTPVARQKLLEAVWSYADGVETHTLETHIYRLRQKIEADPANPALLVTDEDGYRLSD